MRKEAGGEPGTPQRKRSFVRYFLLFVLLSVLAGTAGAYGWLNSLVDDLHSDKGSIDRTRKYLSGPSGDAVNILLIGTDKAFNGETGRSDTIIVMNINYERNRVYLVSIPRDTRTYIPGLGMNKINAAYAYGGPAKTIAAVRKYTGVEINHYVEIDFRGFRKIVDALGGVDVEVKETINNTTPAYRMYIPKGRQRMSGETALNYVRYRHGDSDFKRAERQQNFLKALSGNATRWQTFWKIPRVISIVAKNAETDMSRGDLLSLANFLRGISAKRLETATLVGKTGMLDGVSYVFPNEGFNEAIFSAVERGRSLQPVVKAAAEGKMNFSSSTRISVLNGTGVPGIAALVGKQAEREGFKVVAVGNASSYNYQRTQVVYSSGSYVKAAKLRKLVLPGADLSIGNQEGGSDITVIVGKNYVSYKGSMN